MLSINKIQRLCVYLSSALLAKIDLYKLLVKLNVIQLN